MKVSVELQKEFINLLVSLPNLHDSEGQRAFIFHANLDPQLQNQIVFGKSIVQFATLLIPLLFNYTKLCDGRYSIEAVLDTTKQYVSKERGEYIDGLVQKFVNEIEMPIHREFEYLTDELVKDSTQNLQENYDSLVKKTDSVTSDNIYRNLFDYVSLVAGIVAIINLVMNSLQEEVSLTELNYIALLIILSILIVLELLSPNQNFRIDAKFALPLILFSIGISVAFQTTKEIENILLSGSVHWLLFMVTHIVWRYAIKMPAYDQGTLVASFIAGLCVKPEDVIVLFFGLNLLGSAFYLPMTLLRRRWQPSVPILPFMVIAVIFINTPYYQKIEIMYTRQVQDGHIALINSLIHGNGELIVSPIGSSAQISLDYTQIAGERSDDITFEELKSLYQEQKPVLGFNIGKTLWSVAISYINPSYPQYLKDYDTGIIFTVKHLYYIHSHRKVENFINIGYKWGHQKEISLIKRLIENQGSIDLLENSLSPKITINYADSEGQIGLYKLKSYFNNNLPNIQFNLLGSTWLKRADKVKYVFTDLNSDVEFEIHAICYVSGYYKERGN